jgi:hypothetical protein
LGSVVLLDSCILRRKRWSRSNYKSWCDWFI